MAVTHRHHLALKSSDPQLRLLRVMLFILTLSAVFSLDLWLFSRIDSWPLLSRLEKELPSVLAFGLGLFVLLLLYAVVWGVIKILHCAGGTENEREVQPLALSPVIGLFEQLLFYIAAIGGPDVFKYAVGGWLVLKVLTNTHAGKSHRPNHPLRNALGGKGLILSIVEKPRSPTTDFKFLRSVLHCRLQPVELRGPLTTSYCPYSGMDSLMRMKPSQIF